MSTPTPSPPSAVARSVPVRALLHRLPLLAALLALGGCADSILQPVGPVGEQERTILLDAVVIMGAIVGPTILATLFAAFWFRSSNSRAVYRPDFAYSGRLELIVWSIPALTILFLGGICWVGSHELDPAKPLPSAAAPLEVDVVALDWKWLFIYPQLGVASVNELAAPVNRPLHLRITSASVFNVFFVPRLGTQIYAMNGMISNLNLMADKVGAVPGISAHFSGDGFSTMGFQFAAMSPADFAGWTARARSGGPTLDPVSYKGLLAETYGLKPYTYRSVDPSLFMAIVTGKEPPQPGPRPALRPTTAVDEAARETP